MQWQVQEAKQKFSEVLRRAHEDGPQIVTRHGTDVAVVIDIREYRRLKGEERSLKDFVLTPASGVEVGTDAFADLVDSVVAERSNDSGRATGSLFDDE